MPIAIKSRQVIDGKGAAPIPHGVVLVEGERIKAVGSPQQIGIPEGTEVIDLSDETVLPGLIDAHTHAVLRESPKTAAEQHLAPNTKLSLIAAQNIRADLRSGVTTIRTMSDRDFLDVYLREAVEEGEVAGPRMVIATRGIRSVHGWGSSAVVVNGVDETRRAVRENILWGADLIKLMVTSFGGRDPAKWQERAFDLSPTLTRAEIAAAIDEAHRMGIPVAAHLHGGPALRWALEDGLDTVEHGGFVTEDDIELFLESGGWLVFTLTVLFDPSGLPGHRTYSVEPFRRQLLERQERTRRLLPKVAKAGVNFTVGTDGRHGKFHLELRYLVELGLSPMDAIVAGTRRAAEALRVDDRVGTLEAGKLADIISVPGDPLQDITALQRVGLIMRSGRRYDVLSPI
ncbi:MAG: amidohydrolase family protein [Armatimonadota bacterium]